MRSTPIYILFAVFVRHTWALCLALGVLTAAAVNGYASELPKEWVEEWPRTDFSKHMVSFEDILSGGVSKDGIRSIDNPSFTNVSEIEALVGTEPVVSVTLEGQARAYPIRILTRHEIVNDVFEGRPIAVTFCPLCNAAIAFDRRVGGQVLEFGVSGKLRNSDLVMYDRTTESWWQQFTGQAIVGEMSGIHLSMLPVRLESWDRFKARFPNGEVMLSPFAPLESYSENPYVKYDSSRRPFLYDGAMPKNIRPMARVVVIEDHAWPLEVLRDQANLETDIYRISWTAGQNSALDTAIISKGRDVGNIVVQRKTDSGWVDAVHDVTFAFVFHAFHPEGVWHF